MASYVNRSPDPPTTDLRELWVEELLGALPRGTYTRVHKLHILSGMDTPPPTLQDTADRIINRLRNRVGAHQADLAEAVGITRGSLSQRLLGHDCWKRLPVVASFFGVEVSTS